MINSKWNAKTINLPACLFSLAMTAFLFAAPALAGETTVAAIGFGKGASQLGGFAYDKTKDILIPGPGAFACGPDGNIYLVDSSKFRVIKIDPASGKVSPLFSYRETRLGENYVSDIAVTPGGEMVLFAEDEKLFYVFSAEGKLLHTAGEANGERRVIRSLGGVFCHTAGRTGGYLIKACDRQESSVFTFSRDGSLASETAAKFTGTSFTVGPNGKFYHGYFDYSSFVVANLEKTEEIILNYEITGRPDGLIVHKAYLIGIGPAMEVYLRLVLVDEKTGGRKNSIMRFSHSKKTGEAFSEYYDPSAQNLLLNRPYILAGDGSVVTYRITSDAWELLKIDL